MVGKGYFWDNNILKHEMEEDMGEHWIRIVVPKCFRQKILGLAHKNPMAGHLYTWLGIG